MSSCRLGKEDRNETMRNQQTVQIKLNLWNTEAVGGNRMCHIL